MGFSISEWLNLTFRWIHVLRPLCGSVKLSFFTWMDRALNAEESLWMVHSGGFYIVQRQKIPNVLPQQLQFRWEAALTWIAGWRCLSLFITRAV